MKNLIPRGKLIAVGGNEDKGTYPTSRSKRKYYLNFFELGILKRVVSESGKADPRIEVITTASMIPQEVGPIYMASFAMLNCHNVGIMDIRTPQDARQPEYLERLLAADVIMMSGGNQQRLRDMFAETDFLDALLRRYYAEPDFVIAGTSAGAMAMSQHMIRGGSVPDSLLKGAVKMGVGLGLLPAAIVDSHFVKRGRFGRLIEAVALHPKLIGIGTGRGYGRAHHGRPPGRNRGLQPGYHHGRPRYRAQQHGGRQKRHYAFYRKRAHARASQGQCVLHHGPQILREQRGDGRSPGLVIS